MTDETKGRLYLVVETKEQAGDMDDWPTTREKIVEANSQAQAISKVMGTRFTAKAATAKEVARVMAAEYQAKGA